MRRIAALLTLLAGLALLAPQAGAVLPDEILDDPKLEERAREISKNLRCVVCQNQSIDDSNADLARDLRLIVRERLTAGDSKDEVVQYVVDRYGAYVLLKPPFNMETAILWASPVLILLAALASVFWWYRSRQLAPAAAGAAAPGTSRGRTAPLSDEEKKRLDALLKDD